MPTPFTFKKFPCVNRYRAVGDFRGSGAVQIVKPVSEIRFAEPVYVFPNGYDLSLQVYTVTYMIPFEDEITPAVSISQP